MRWVRISTGAMASLLVLSLTLLTPGQSASVIPQGNAGSLSVWAGPNTLGSFVHRMSGGKAVCLEPGIEQARAIKDRDTNLSLTTLTDPPDTQRSGSSIVLRGTSQLQASPAATEAFRRAAAQWETQIRTPMSIVIDVDFGATLFGKQFDGDVVAATDAQVLGGNSFYPAVRSALIGGPYSPSRTTLYNSLPPRSLPTDRGETTGLLAPSATLRALDLIDPDAKPNDELSDFGPPPAIGFNSAFNFDFDAGDGIDTNKLDFEAMALHEIGHVLGFTSFVGQQEMDPSIELEPSIWDLFRMRPEFISGDFATTQRILSSGGEQSFWAGDAKHALSTGRPDGASGDGRHASHFQDDDLTGQYLGVMDPTIARGEHHFVTDNDLTVLEAIGYRVRSLSDPTTVVPLESGLPQIGGMFAPPPNLGALSHTHYSIDVPSGAAQLKIELSGNQDVDLFARFGRTVFNNGHSVIADYGSTSESGSETITITPSSSPSLRPGIYYIAIANFGPGDADFTITATVTGGNTSRAPAIFDIRPQLEGDLLTLECAAADRDGDLATAEVSLLDESELAVSQSSRFEIGSGESTRTECRLIVSGLSTLPATRLAAVVFIDRAGNRSARALVDIGKREAGGLILASASLNGSKLTLKTSGLASSLRLEINGQIISPPRKIKVKGSGKKLVINGDEVQLNLRPGTNRIRVKNANGWSNILMLSI